VSVPALKRLMLAVGILVLLVSLIIVRRVHTAEPVIEAAFIAALAAGVFFSAAGLIGVLTEPPETPDEREGEELALAEERAAGHGPTIGAAMGGYLLVIALIVAGVVGIAQNDIGAAIQTFTAALVLGGVIFGIGWLLAYRPPVEE
jgi:hypothetical protein